MRLRGLNRSDSRRHLSVRAFNASTQFKFSQMIQSFQWVSGIISEDNHRSIWFSFASDKTMLDDVNGYGAFNDESLWSGVFHPLSFKEFVVENTFVLHIV